MTAKELKEIIDRYQQGHSTESEKALVDSLFDSFRKKNQRQSYRPNNPELLGAAMLQNIKDGINQQKKQSFQYIYKIAASFALLIGIATAIYLNTRAVPVSQPKYITKTTRMGQKATIKLKDGSTVRLNSGSSIRYPENFSEDQREVELVGEAFFDVSKDTERPFAVTSKGILTTVLGTSFNVNAYDSLSVSIALVEGKVKVQSTNEVTLFNQSEVFLNPGESAVFDGISGDINIGSFNMKKMTAWKDGIIYMDNASYNQVFDQLSRWYGVAFTLENRPNIKWVYSGEFKDMSLELILNTIGYSAGFTYEILDKNVVIKFTS